MQSIIITLALLTQALTNLQTTLQQVPIETPVVYAGTWDKEAIIQHIKTKAIENNVDFVVALAIVQAESKFNPKALGDGGKSRGLWQIYKPAHPQITDAQAYNIIWSTDWAIQQLKDGKCKIWSTCPLRSN